ncbi:MAG TPA: hypothetical protein DCZ10_18655 [Pelotomaculum sp.]|nr:hypothetical protein [Pelotomaculum sp.]
MAFLSYSFRDLQSYIWTRDSFTVTNTENVDVVLVQYGQTTGGAVNLKYSLVISPDSFWYWYGPIQVNGKYKSSSRTITFEDVSPGTYYLLIENEGTDIAIGNGHIYY